MNSDRIRELVSYLSYFGEVKFRPCRFPRKNGVEVDGEGIDYASVELVVSEPIAKGLEEFINSHLGVNSGARASMKFVALGSRVDGKYRYAADIIPNKDVPYHEREDATEDYIQRLPKVIKNFRHLNPSKSRGR